MSRSPERSEGDEAIPEKSCDYFLRLIMRWLGKGRLRFLRRQRGFTLIEVLVAVAILAAIGVTFISAIGTGYGGVKVIDEKTQAEALIRSQLDALMVSTYEDSEMSAYPRTDMYLEQRITDLPPQYSIVITVETPQQIGLDRIPLEELMAYDITTIQEITISVFRADLPILSIGSYKVKE